MMKRLGERGAVTAEFALALPAAMLVILVGVGAMGAAGRQIRLQDAAADAARLAARGEDLALVRSHVSAAADGAVAEVAERGDLICVTAVLSGAPFPQSAASCALAGGL